MLGSRRREDGRRRRPAKRTHQNQESHQNSWKNDDNWTQVVFCSLSVNDVCVHLAIYGMPINSL